jgi:serine/threonine-protein kinase
VDFSRSDDGSKVFTLLSWIPGTEVEKVLPQMNRQEQYALGVQAGEILWKIHETTPVTDAKSWYDRYFEVLAPRLDAYREKGIPFDGSEAILAFIEENKHLLKTRPQCHHHGDYHVGNLIVRDGKVWVIDWHMVDFDGEGDPWYEFNRLGLEHPAFVQGQIDGYFQNQVPEEFWRLFALYVATSAITSIVWAKYRAPEALDWVMTRNRDVVQMFDRMQNPVPLWYRRKSEDR